LKSKGLSLTPDSWLTEILKLPSYKVAAQSIRDYQDWKGQAALGSDYFVTIKTNVKDVSQIDNLKNRITFIQKMNQYSWNAKPHHVAKDGYTARFSVAQDIDEILELGSRAFELSRFHRDKKFSHKIAEEIKSRWLLSNLTIRENCDTLILVNLGGEIVGFSSILSYPDRLVIDLISVSQKFRSQGLGKLLVYHSQVFAYGKNLPLIVGTQSENKANVMYQNTGFKLVDCQYVWHDITQESI